jgi:hypothetical protein
MKEENDTQCLIAIGMAGSGKSTMISVSLKATQKHSPRAKQETIFN